MSRSWKKIHLWRAFYLLVFIILRYYNIHKSKCNLVGAEQRMQAMQQRQRTKTEQTGFRFKIDKMTELLAYAEQ